MIFIILPALIELNFPTDHTAECEASRPSDLSALVGAELNELVELVLGRRVFRNF